MKKSQTQAARKRLERQRKREKGLKQFEVWLPNQPEILKQHAAFVAKLNEDFKNEQNALTD